jgi:hypothetical protein
MDWLLLFSARRDGDGDGDGAEGRRLCENHNSFLLRPRF